MSLTITSANPQAGCSEHRLIVVDDEGTQRQFTVTLAEVDQWIEDLGGSVKAKRVLVMLWACYRRAQGRPIVGVPIA